MCIFIYLCTQLNFVCQVRITSVSSDPSIVAETLVTNMVGSGLTGWVNENPSHHDS